MKLFTFTLSVLLLIPATIGAQCRTFTKNNVLPLLEGYSQNDRYNTVSLIPGDEAELVLTFYPGREYMLAVVADPALGAVNFEIRDTDYRYVRSNINDDDNTMTYGFNVQKTELLILSINVPDRKNAIGPQEGCVTVMYGVKDLNSHPGNDVMAQGIGLKN